MRKVLCLLVLFSGLIYAQETQYKYLSGKSADDNVEWDFFCSDGRKSGKWDKIRVPSCWELEGYGIYNYGHDRNKASEIGTYKTRFTVHEDWKKKRIFIVFDGSMTDTKVKVNGKQAGAVHQGAFYRFKREITSLVSFKKENVLEVEVSKMSSNKSVNEAERNADFWVFGGIFRPVYLEAVPENFIEYTGVDAKHDGTLNLEVNIDKASDKIDICADVYDISTGQKLGNIGKNFTEKSKQFFLSGKIAGIKPWTCETPNLYKAVVTVSRNGKTMHSVTERIGFRTIQVKERDGVYINDEKVRFKGVNRHCFWPTTGRTVSREQSLLDAELIKEMNMNAVRMSHYPPDKHFLEICDSIGLYVIDELCAWQKPPYDTPVGTILTNEMLKRDINHPSIIFWANGNEGGFNYDLDPLFAELDIQKRSVLHPWGLSGKVNTAHYINYNSGIKSMFNGRDIFMPTELIHGLYDGGHGAGLDDYWNLMLDNPLAAGMFLWDFADQGVVRTDKNGILDTDKDHGADGIVGPYREKEGSFYTVKEIWSPIYVENRYLTDEWDGTINIENRYDFTNAKECSYSFRLTEYDGLSGIKKEASFDIESPNIEPGNKGKLRLNLPENWKKYDFLYLTIKDKYGKELFTWDFEVNSPEHFVNKTLKTADTGNCSIKETEDVFMMEAAGVCVSIDKTSGLIKEVSSNEENVPLTNGPVYITDKKLKCRSVKMREDNGCKIIEAVYNFDKGGEAYRFAWRMSHDGILSLKYSYRPQDKIRMSGVTFDFPEKDIEGTMMLANGPYRVYNNRMKGGTVQLWDKKYNDAITGEEWIYPEFKGYYSLFYGMRLKCPTPFEIYSGSEDLTLHLFTPKPQRLYDVSKNYTIPPYPKGNISFMDAIPAVGTKFGSAENYGPQSQPHRFKRYSGLKNMENTIYFKFN